MIEKISGYCRNAYNFVYEGSLSVYELVLKVLEKEDELVDSVNDLEERKENSSDITNSRKLSESGNFTGLLNGFPIVQTEAGLASIVTGLEAKDIVHDGQISSLIAKDVSLDSNIASLVAKDLVHDGQITTLTNKDIAHDNSITALIAKDVTHDTSISNAEANLQTHINTNLTFLPTTNSLPSPMSFNTSPTSGSHLKIFDGDGITPTTAGNIPSASIQRVDSSAGSDTSKDHLTALLVTHKRNEASRGYAFATYNYLEDYSNEPLPAQSVACAGSAHGMGLSQVWGLYGEGWQQHINAKGTGAEIDCFNYSGVDNEYNDINPFATGHAKALLLGNGGTDGKKALMALGVTGSPTRAFRCGIHLAQYSCDKYAMDILATPETIIRFKSGCMTEGLTGGIGLDTGKNASYGVAKDQGAIHLWDNALVFGQSDLASYGMRFDAVTEKLNFYRVDADGTITTKGFIDMSVATGVSHAL